MLYLQGYNYSEIASISGITTQAVQGNLSGFVTPLEKTWHTQQRAIRLASEHQTQLDRLRPAINLMTAAGYTKIEMRQLLGIGDAILSEIINSLGITGQLKWESALHSRPRRYTEQIMLKYLRQAAELNGGQIGIRSYGVLRRTHPDWPTSDLYKIKGWNWWLKKAGIPTSTAPRAAWKPSYCDSDCQAAVTRIAQILNRPYSKTDYTNQRLPHEPTHGTISRRYGQGIWLSALEHLVPKLFVEDGNPNQQASQ